MEALLGGHRICDVEEGEYLAFQATIRSQELLETGPCLSLQLVETLFIRVDYFNAHVDWSCGWLRCDRYCGQSAWLTRACGVRMVTQALSVRAKRWYAAAGLGRSCRTHANFCTLRALLQNVHMVMVMVHWLMRWSNGRPLEHLHLLLHGRSMMPLLMWLLVSLLRPATEIQILLLHLSLYRFLCLFWKASPSF